MENIEYGIAEKYFLYNNVLGQLGPSTYSLVDGRGTLARLPSSMVLALECERNAVETITRREIISEPTTAK